MQLVHRLFFCLFFCFYEITALPIGHTCNLMEISGGIRVFSPAECGYRCGSQSGCTSFSVCDFSNPQRCTVYKKKLIEECGPNGLMCSLFKQEQKDDDSSTLSIDNVQSLISASHPYTTTTTITKTTTTTVITTMPVNHQPSIILTAIQPDTTIKQSDSAKPSTVSSNPSTTLSSSSTSTRSSSSYPTTTSLSTTTISDKQSSTASTTEGQVVQSSTSTPDKMTSTELPSATGESTTNSQSPCGGLPASFCQS